MTPRFEDVTEVPDGVRVIFTTQYYYIWGSVRVFINGQLKTIQREDGWIERGSRKVELKEPPRVGEHVILYYLPLV